MCGLSAIVEFKPGDRLIQDLLAMHERIPHRGPDGEGFALVDAAWCAASARTVAELPSSAAANLRLGMAFRWLQIQDPGEAAAQPMGSPDGSTWLMFNGEVYNFQEIRQELAQLGHRFASVSDTEVILAAYGQWGTGCFSRLNGMWAMVLLDLRSRKIIISRDRFGIKPLFYHRGKKRLVIASEIKQLLAAGVPATANHAAVSRFICNLRPETCEETFFKDIFAQPAATFAEISLENSTEIKFQRYWSLDPPAVDTTVPLDTACTKLDNLLTRSVLEHMVAEAPLGHLISGGLDSSLVAALAAPNYSRRGERGLGVSMVLATKLKGYDESAYIDQVVTALKFRSVKAQFSAAWLKANINRITETQEEPVGGMAVAGQFLAYETAARQGVRVILDGQGADEIFAGYPRHQHTVLKDYVRHLAPLALLHELTSLWRHDAKFFGDLWRLRIVPRFARGLGIGKMNSPRDFLRPEGNHPLSKRKNQARQGFRSTALREELLNDILAGNLRPVLAMTDRNSMAHSIEARVPYVDSRIVELAFQLPDTYKVGGGKRKRILRLIAEHYLPDAIVSRVDRIGFGAPIEQWLTTDFHAELTRLPDNGVFSRSDLVDPSLLRQYIKGFLMGGHRDSGTIWRLYAVDIWARVYCVSGI
jgi:asparagine synthase (glutamine-hydrolysing)